MRNQLLILLVLAVTLFISAHGFRKDGCIYKKARRQRADCVNGTKTITGTLARQLDQSANCNQTAEVTKSCTVKKEKCKYDYLAKVPCNDNGLAEVPPLKESSTCQKKIISCKKLQRKQMKKLKKKDKKNRMSSDSRKAQKLARKKARKEAKKAQKNAKRQRKQRKKGRKNKKGRQEKCKYTPGPWQECDHTTDSMSRTYTLSSGDPQNCPATKVLRKKCRKSCKYKAGKWSKCNSQTMVMARIDTLKPKSASYCSKTRTISKKCKKRNKPKCKYDKGEWSECDPVTMKRTKTKQLKNKDKNPNCPETKTEERFCKRPDGTERCFFGRWEEWEDCQNGVQKKHRAVIGGGDECQRQSVKTRMCTITKSKP